MKSIRHILLITGYGIFSCFVFFSYGLPSLEGEIPQQLYSDSVTYENFAKLNADAEFGELVGAAKNLYGPVYVTWFFEFNRTAIFLFNFAILLLSYFVVIKYVQINSFRYLVLLLLNPLVFFSLFGVNKEVFALLAISCFSALIYKRSVWLFLFTCFVAFFARWQMLLFVILCFPLLVLLEKYKFKSGLAILLLLLAISILYPMLMSDAFDKVESVSSDAAQLNIAAGSSGFYAKMHEVQRNFGYFFAFIPKLLQLAFGSISQFSLDPLNFWNGFVLPLQSLFTFWLVFMAAIKKRLSCANKLIFSVLVFAALFVTTPIYNSRYLYPASILLSIVLSMRALPHKQASRELDIR